MAIFGSLSTVRAQVANAEKFRASFDYLEKSFLPGSDSRKRLEGLSPGMSERIELPGGAFALQQVYVSKNRPEGFFESHRAYIDIQAILSGAEIIEAIEISALKLKEDRTPKQDVLVYEMAEAASGIRMETGQVAILFPVDGHMGGLTISEPRIVRKIVIKVPVD